MSTFLTSDQHFGHRNILTIDAGRPFASIEEHDETLIERWNAVVRPGDRVLHLGDFSLSVPEMERVVRRLNGDITLYAGNHDRCWTAHPSPKRSRKAHALVPRFLAAGFTGVVGSGHGFAQVAGIDVMVAHLPADGDHADPKYAELGQRYADQRPRSGDLPLVCGHVHAEWTTCFRQVNVGVDRWGFAPVHEDVIADVLRALPGSAQSA